MCALTIAGIIIVLIIVYYFATRESLTNLPINNRVFINNPLGDVAYYIDGEKRILTDVAKKVCPPAISATLSIDQWNSIPNGILFTKETCGTV